MRHANKNLTIIFPSDVSELKRTSINTAFPLTRWPMSSLILSFKNIDQCDDSGTDIQN